MSHNPQSSNSIALEDMASQPEHWRTLSELFRSGQVPESRMSEVFDKCTRFWIYFHSRQQVEAE